MQRNPLFDELVNQYSEESSDIQLQFLLTRFQSSQTIFELPPLVQEGRIILVLWFKYLKH